jgi:hypothetical protein
LHQTGYLHLLDEFYTRTLIPFAVVRELELGRAIGIDLPKIGIASLDEDSSSGRAG